MCCKDAAPGEARTDGRTAPHDNMSADDFQSKYASVMESMLKSAVAETTKLFETMVNELKAEISRIKEENEDLKTRCSQFERAKSRPALSAAESQPLPATAGGSGRRDTAVQCELVPLRTMLVEQCQSSLQNQEQQWRYDEMEYGLQEHNYVTHREVKQEDDNDSFLQSVFKQEEEEHSVVCGSVMSDKEGSLWPSGCGTENVGCPTDHECSSGEIPLPEKHEALELSTLEIDGDLQGVQNQDSKIMLLYDDTEESEISLKILDIRTEADLITSGEQPLAAVPHQSEIEYYEKEEAAVVQEQCQQESEMSVSDQTDVTLRQSADVQWTVEQVADPAPQNKEVVNEELKTDMVEGEASSQPVCRRRGRPPKRGKHLQQQVKEVQSSTDVITKQDNVTSPSRRVKEAEVCSVVDTVNAKASESPVKSKMASIISPSVQERQNTALHDVDKRKVLSAVALGSQCSSEKEKQSEFRHPFMEIEDAVVQPPTNDDSSANTPPTESQQAALLKPGHRRTSVTLQDAMLLVEAMNLSTVENAVVSPQRIPTPPQTQCASSVGTLQTVDEIPTKTQIQSLPDVAHETKGQLPTSKQSAVETLNITPKTRYFLPNNEGQAQFKVVKENQKHPATQTSVMSLQKHSLQSLITAVAQSKGINAALQKIIVVPKSTSLSSAKLPSFQNTNLLAVSAAPSSPLGTTSLSPVIQKIYVTSEKLHPPCPSQSSAKSKDQQSGTLPPPKITILIPRQAQTAALKTMQDSAKSAAPTKLPSPQLSSSSQGTNVSLDDQTISDEVSTLSAQKSNNTFEHLESDEQSTSLPEITTTSTKTGSSLKRSFGQMPAFVFPVVQPTAEQKHSAMVRLTRLPFSITTKESVLVSTLLSKGTSECQNTLTENPQKKPSSAVILTKPSGMLVVSTGTSPNIKATSVAESEESNDVQEKVSAYSEASAILKYSQGSTLLQPFTSSNVSAPVFEEPAVAITTTPSYLDDIISDAVQNDTLPNNPSVKGNESAAPLQLIAVTSKDTSDPHLQMTKAQFLAQLAVSPVPQTTGKVSTNDFADETACGKKNSLVARLRSHLKTHLQSRRAESNPELCREIETTTVSPKKPKLGNAHPNDKSTSGHILMVENVTSLKTTNDPALISPVSSEPCKDDVSSESVGQPTAVSCRRSRATSEPITVSVRTTSGKDSVGSKNKQHSSLSPRRSSPPEDRALPKNTKSTFVSRKRIGSTKDGASPKITKSTSLTPKRTVSTRDSAILKITRSTSPRNPRMSKISSESFVGSYKRSTLTKVGPNTKQIKRESNYFSPRRYSVTTDGAVTEKAKIETASPSTSWHEPAKDGVTPRKTGESTPTRRPRVSQDGTGPKKNLRLLNAKKLAKAAKAKTVAKLKTSNQTKLQNGAKTTQLAENQANCEPVKKCKTTAVWIPPRMPVSKIPKTEIKASDHTAVYPPSVSLPPIPVKAPPIVSPLQPLSVIGGRLLKNQCGECGRVLSSSAALESHVGLHTGRRPFSCTLCGKSFPDLKGLKRHGRVHRNGRIHVCPQCGKGFVYRFGLTKHLQMVHGRLKPFVCQICSKGFYTKKDVEAHIRIHTGEKPFHCNLCDKRFTRRVELNVHLRWHNGEKRHWCPYCGKGFLDFNNLKRHKYIHTGEKPHSCPHCPKHFTQSGHLKKHVKNVHKAE